MATLKHGGIVRTTLGAHGGYAMADDPSTVSVGRVIRLLDGALAPLPCVSLRYYGRCSCPDEATCALRDVMLDVRDAMLAILDNQTLADWPPARAGPRSTRAASTPTPWPAAAPEPASASGRRHRRPAPRPTLAPTDARYCLMMRRRRTSVPNAQPRWTRSPPSSGFGRGLWLFPLDIDVPDGRPALRLAQGRCSSSTPPPSCARSASSAPSGPPGGRADACRRTAGTSRNPASTSPALFPLGILRHLPETDKASYVDRYGLLERCVGGAVPYPGTTIDESSGSTGHAVQLDPRPDASARSPIATSGSSPATRSGRRRWSRSTRSRWAPGRPASNMSLGMLRHGIVKSIGPGPRQDPLDARATSGRRYRFLISGYPPFLKHLLDEGERRGFPWADYELHGAGRRRGHDRGAARRPPRSASRRSTRATGRPTSRSAWPASRRSVDRPPSLARARPDIRRELFGAGPAAADGLPVQPADPLHGGQRPAARSSAPCRASTCSRRGSATTSTTPGGIVDFARVRAGPARRTASTSTDARTSAPEVARPTRPLPWATPDPAAVPVDPRPARRDGQRHGLEHLPRGRRDGRLPRSRSSPRGCTRSMLVGRRRRGPGRPGRRSPWS